eukprot:TRINITY_DN4720_c0_g1_i5.p1 TRINITY_DN4720_c0_g1~~TRINITY_DN4720_c0_g1_i5.p1  ORF type:complete len:199 (-),score=48.18 TRINITY_DN4720_c0_g1_i5:970-1566(-)
MTQSRCSVQFLKFVVVGDGAVGKTSMLISYTSGVFSGDYIPTIFENFGANTVVDGITTGLQLWDTAGQEDYDRLRPLSYHLTDLFLVLFAVNCDISYKNVTEKWMPEVQHYCPDATVVLVGTKSDMRHDPQAALVRPDEGQALARAIGAVAYCECSAKTMEGLSDLFTTAIRAARRANCCNGCTRRSARRRKQRCSAL